MDATAEVSVDLRELLVQRSCELAAELSSDDVLLSVSPTSAALLGAAPVELRGRTLAELVHPDERDDVTCAMVRARVTGDDVEFRSRLGRAEGSWAWFDAVLRPGADDTLLLLARDVSAHVERQASIDRILEAIDEHVYVNEVLPDGTRRNLFLGPGRERLIGGVPQDGDWGRAWVDAIHPDDRGTHLEHTRRYLRGEASVVTYRLRGLDGVTRWIEGGGRPRRVGERMIVDGIVRDVTERRRHEERLRQALSDAEKANELLEVARAEADRRSRVDALTGVFNRRHFGMALAAEIERARRKDLGVGIALLDIDHFKQVNDRHGHGAGDLVLGEVARRLRRAVRPYDTLARWGGEEFIVLLPGVENDDELRLATERLREAVKASPIVAGDQRLRITMSAGAARADLETADTLTVDAADRALYAAKRGGRDRVLLDGELSPGDVVADEPDVVRMAKALALAASLHEGLPVDHGAQVGDLGEAIARRLGLDADAVSRTYMTGCLHDLGKIAIPDEILNKPRRLDAEDWAVMRTHSQLGASVLARLPELRAVAAGVRHHHERVDGNGYPDGLRGTQIPIEARIVAAADAYHAIISQRVYAPARSSRAAVDELRRVAGSQLDAEVVAALLEVLQEPPTAAGDGTFRS
jgi:diguanylate cyclase (GGDEF)-like protein/PAS domain S-box-containing protein